MHLFIDYVQPLTEWLQNNPHWALLITFLISLTESLAIIGSIVPGSITMTAIGILAGSGIMRIDLTLLASILGAITGDSLSYALGYYYSDRLTEIWPFSKYPKWLEYGKDFFAIHGGKSVLIGRFVGPLRSIIPLIAGVMHMKQWRFFVANVLSAIGWSFLYVLPGIMIGAVSQELSAESATRLFVLILLVLVGIWFLGLIIKKMVRLINSVLKLYLHNVWLKFKKNFLLVHIYTLFTPRDEKDHYVTALLVLLTLSVILFFIILLILSVETHWLDLINVPTHLFFQSFNNLILNAFFIFCTQLTSTITLSTLFILCCCWLIYRNDVTTILYLLSLIIFSALLALLLSHSIYRPRPSGIMVIMPGSSFPVIHLQIATTLYSFITYYINNTYSIFLNPTKSILFTILGLSGLGTIYLGDNWVSDVLAAYFLGASISLIHCLIYRKAHPNRKKITNSLLKISPLFITLILSSLLSTYLNFTTLAFNHTPYYKKFYLSETTWWEHEQPILPLYQLNRIGKKISLLNLQYVGDLNLLQSKLEHNGWVSHSNTFFSNLIMRMNKQPNSVKLPLFTQLYENKAPTLMMTYTNHQSMLAFELRFWESNYKLLNSNKPLWIGSIHPSKVSINKEFNKNINLADSINPIRDMITTEDLFDIKLIKLSGTMIKPTIYPTKPYIILIKQK